MIDPSAQAFTAQGVYARGVAVTFERLTGYAPNVVTLSAAVVASIDAVTPDSQEVAQTGYGAARPGAITQDERLIIVMAADLTAQGFPLPVAKGDKVIATDTGEKFVVMRVNSYKRAMAGAIELIATGV